MDRLPNGVPTVLLAPEDLAGEVAEITGDLYRHLFRASRHAVGDPLRVVDGRGRARWAEVTAVDRRAGHLALLEPAPPNEPEYALTLIVGTPKKERAAWLVEKATELGVTHIAFVASARSPRELGPGSLERLTRVAAAAVEQCGRSVLPAITGVHPWREVPTLLQPIPDRWVLAPAAEGGGWGEKTAAAGVVLIGPEGGFTPEEVAELVTLGCRPVCLGERILRVETAAVVAAARWL
ncbi:MAG: RsmE family RNA methyltransferase [Thermoanaerobaculia bacterium]|nr:RsmE family RNA methyltransferase [Thermoanaerobaculia bacterium]